MPIAGFAKLSDDHALSLEGRVGAIDGSELLIEKQQLIMNAKHDFAERIVQAEQLGEAVAERLIARGARVLLDQAYDE